MTQTDKTNGLLSMGRKRGLTDWELCILIGEKKKSEPNIFLNYIGHRQMQAMRNEGKWLLSDSMVLGGLCHIISQQTDS